MDNIKQFYQCSVSKLHAFLVFLFLNNIQIIVRQIFRHFKLLFDIQNEKTSTDGFFINYQETLRLFFRFQNDGDYAISFTYSVEYGEVNVTLAPHETKDIILEVANDKDVDGLRPYHHVTLTQDLAGQTDLVIAAFILNTNA